MFSVNNYDDIEIERARGNVYAENFSDDITCVKKIFITTNFPSCTNLHDFTVDVQSKCSGSFIDKLWLGFKSAHIAAIISREKQIVRKIGISNRHSK